MANPLFLYSTNTWLTYVIAKRYYQDEHYVWCTPYFDSKSLPSVDATTPPTSTPSDIYHNLDEEVRRGDRHSSKIQENRAGILRGSALKLAAGVINQAQETEINAIVRNAEIRDFRPLLYLMPYTLVSGMLVDVPVEKRAHPLSIEYTIERLPRACFEIIELARR